VSESENCELTKQFQEVEIKLALFHMEKNKVACSDGFPTEFFQTCWEFIKSDICELFLDFFQGSLDVTRIQHFRPICLLNCLYKWFTKVLTMRLEPIAGRIIHKSQTAFIQGRIIMNGVMALHETKRGKEVGVILKIDFEKAYDKVHWGF
jgi:hypothetical protein